MEILALLGVAYGAVFIWLAVRIINRPKQWNTGNNITLFLVLLVAPAIGAVCLLPLDLDGRPARHSQCRNNLKQIGLALHNYAEQYGSFPPAYIADENGRPMHSWRVLILPQLDRQDLYKLYRFDEPWDGPNNRQLADNVVRQFKCPSDDQGDPKTSPTMTSYLAVVGPETVWLESGVTTFRDITDGTSTTLLVVEVANSGIHWMEPRDLHMTQMAPRMNAKSGQGISSRHTGGANSLCADASVRFLSDNLTADELRAWLTAHASDITKDN